MAACSLAVSLDGLSGGDAAAADASLDAIDNDGAADAAAIDATGGDSAIDGGGVDACATADFCDHFDRDVVKGDWASAFTDNGGVLELDTSTSVSPSKSLRITVPASGNPHAQLSSRGFPSVAHARVSFDMKSQGFGRQMAHIRMQLTEPSGRNGAFDLFSLNDRFVVTEQVFGNPSLGYGDFTINSGFKADTWQRWTMELDARTTPTGIVVTLDGVEVVRKTLKNTFARATLSILLGAFYAPDGPVRVVSYDNLEVQILP